MSALLEVADREFSRLRDQAAAIRGGYVSAIDAGYLDVELVADSLDAYLAHNKRGKKWLDRAVKAGFAPHEPGTVVDPDDDKAANMRSHVLAIAQAHDMSRLDQLDARLIAAIDGGAIEEMVAQGSVEGVLGDTTVFDLLANLLLHKCDGTKEVRRALAAIEWVEEAKEFFVENFKRPPARRRRASKGSG